MAGDPTTLVPLGTAETGMGLVTLEPGAGYTTIINTYVVAPQQADELLRFLIRATEETIRHVPGFVSADFHLNADRTLVVNYAQWLSPEAIMAARDHPGVAQGMREAGQIATSFTPMQFELRRSVTAAAADT